MREVSSDEWIIGPATSRFDWPYLEEAFANGVLPLIDAISVHPYRDQAPPETVMADWDRLRRLVAQYAPPGKNLPLICSEWGYSSYAKGVPAVKQGHYAVRAYLSNLAAGAPLTIWYAWKERPDIESEKEKHFGLVTSDLNPKPGFLTVQSTLASLKGFTLDGKLDLGDSRDLGFVFKKGAEERLAVWTIDNLPKKVMFSRATASLPVHLGGAVTERLVEVTDAVQVLKGL
jgi:hypothetical protein